MVVFRRLCMQYLKSSNTYSFNRKFEKNLHYCIILIRCVLKQQMMLISKILITKDQHNHEPNKQPIQINPRTDEIFNSNRKTWHIRLFALRIHYTRYRVAQKIIPNFPIRHDRNNKCSKFQIIAQSTNFSYLASPALVPLYRKNTILESSLNRNISACA